MLAIVVLVESNKMRMDHISDDLMAVMVGGAVVITVAIWSLPWLWKKTIRPQKRSEAGKTWEARKARRKKAR